MARQIAYLHELDLETMNSHFQSSADKIIPELVCQWMLYSYFKLYFAIIQFAKNDTKITNLQNTYRSNQSTQDAHGLQEYYTAKI